MSGMRAVGTGRTVMFSQTNISSMNKRSWEVRRNDDDVCPSVCLTHSSSASQGHQQYLH